MKNIKFCVGILDRKMLDDLEERIKNTDKAFIRNQVNNHFRPILDSLLLKIKKVQDKT